MKITIKSGKELLAQIKDESEMNDFGEGLAVQAVARNGDKSGATLEQAKELKAYLNYAVKEGYIDEDTAKGMSYEDIKEYRGLSEARGDNPGVFVNPGGHLEVE